MTKPFIDFYNSIGFAPTGQEPALKVEHKQNRNNLYRKLGLHSGIFKSARVLEIGPGSGENSIDLLGRGISSLKLVDGVPEVLSSLQTRIKSETPVTYELSDATIPSTSTETFDIVICEGVIPLQLTPGDFFQNISKSVAPGGLILITTMDGISTLSEVLRRVISFSVKSRHGLKLEDLEDFFKRDFQSLDGMTRTPRNWLLDSVINPWIGNLFSIKDALLSAPADFRPISMTPNLHLDLNWYKSPVDNKSEKEAWTASYDNTCHYLIDYRIKSHLNTSEDLNYLLQELCAQAFLEMQILLASNSLSSSGKFCSIIQRIALECPQLDNLTRLSLLAFINFLNGDEDNSLMDFQPFWGRGQQYLCFERNVD